MTDFEIHVELRGPERTIDTGYGPRTDRDALARLDVPVTGELGWLIYQEAVRRAVAPELRIEFPEAMSTEEANRFRELFRKEFTTHMGFLRRNRL